jgi:phage/plasmid-associated DNA primase
VDEFRGMTSPLLKFINEFCVRDADGTVEAADLYREYRDWSLREGVRHIYANNAFGTQLRATASWIVHQQVRVGDRRPYIYRGIRLLATEPLRIGIYDPEPEGIIS